MAQFNPLFLSGSRIRQMTSSLNTVVDYIHFPATLLTGSSVPYIATTNLPDPYLFASLSANITNNSNTTNQPIYQYDIPNRLEKYFYTSNAIIGVSTTNTTSGVRIGLLRSQLANTAFALKSPSTVTGFTFANVTTLSNTIYVLPLSHPAPGNTIYPTHFKGFTSNYFTNSTSRISNTYVVQPEANVVVSASAGSIFYNQFAGYFSSSFQVDTSFNTGTGFDGQILAIYQQSDSKILVGGGLVTTYSGSSQNRLFRLNLDGTVDTSFNIGTGFGAGVNSIYQQSDGKILVGGTFTTYSGSSQIRFVRLNLDGTKDDSLNIGTGFDFISVNSINQQPDGKILAGGVFLNYSGSGRDFLVRMNSNGTVDTSFNMGVGINGSVITIALQPDNKILVGGNFTSYSGSIHNRLARINPNGTIDTSFNAGTGFESQVSSIAIQSDGKILVGGFFTSFNSSPQNNYIIRLNSNGSIDTSFNRGTAFVDSGFNGGVGSIYQQSDGKILVGGFFSAYSGSVQNFITRLNLNGSIDTSFNRGFGFNNNVRSVIEQSGSNGKALAGGDFSSFDSISSNRIIRLLPTSIAYPLESPLYFNSGSLSTVSGSDTITSSFLSPTSSLWLSQSLATSIGVGSTTTYTNVFTLTGLTTGQRYLVNLYLIGLSDSTGNGFRMRVVTGSQYMGTLWTPTSTSAPAIQNSTNSDNITSIATISWPITSGKYLVYGEYTFVKGATDPQVQIISQTGATTAAISGSVIFYRPII
jgi:uncharacterized delta-60 repeat protein